MKAISISTGIALEESTNTACTKTLPLCLLQIWALHAGYRRAGNCAILQFILRQPASEAEATTNKVLLEFQIL